VFIHPCILLVCAFWLFKKNYSIFIDLSRLNVIVPIGCAGPVRKLFPTTLEEIYKNIMMKR
jgi:hypothetical protein